jgi:hypothetical protein
LTVGYGAFGTGGNRIGPEYLFGLTMEDRLKEPVLIIKTSWGGRSLHTDFRPPSAGPFVQAKKAEAEQFKPEELKRLKAGVSNGGYHYLGAAKIMAPIGQAFADSLLGTK